MKTIKVYFDGHCKLCHWFTRFLIKFGNRKKFKFISLQNLSNEEQHKIDQLGDINSVIVEFDNQYFTRSEAVILCFTHGFKFGKAFYIFRIVPLYVRDKIYDFVSKNRHRWFGRSGI